MYIIMKMFVQKAYMMVVNNVHDNIGVCPPCVRDYLKKNVHGDYRCLA